MDKWQTSNCTSGRELNSIANKTDGRKRKANQLQTVPNEYAESRLQWNRPFDPPPPRPYNIQTETDVLVLLAKIVAKLSYLFLWKLWHDLLRTNTFPMNQVRKASYGYFGSYHPRHIRISACLSLQVISYGYLGQPASSIGLSFGPLAKHFLTEEHLELKLQASAFNNAHIIWSIKITFWELHW
jgi:hypothetical protein